MRILIVNTFYYPNMQGGAEQSVKLLAEGLVNKGHEVAIFCIDSKNGENEEASHNNVKIYRRTSHKFNLYKYSYEKDKVSKIEKVVQKLRCYNNKESVKDFKDVCIDFKPDIIHTNTLYGMSEFIWKAAKNLKIPVVHTIRDIGLISPVQYGHKCNFLLKKMHIMYNKKMSKYVTVVTAPSNYTLKTTTDIIPFKNAKFKKCIFNSVSIDYKKMEQIIKEKEVRKSNIIKFMYAGRLVYFKGIEHMIEAFKMIDNDNIELHICGDGEMHKYVVDSEKQDKRIKYHGKLNNEDLAKCYEACDVLIVPSYWPEPFGRVLIEGNMYGMPVIAGNCGGMPEIIETTKAGEIYTPNSINELHEKMIMFLSRPNIIKYLPKIKANIQIYDVKHQIDKFEQLYRNILVIEKGGNYEK